MKEQILAQLSADYPWKEYLHCFESIDSTNDRLREMARKGAPHGTVLIADHQTGGHGRMGRSFQSPAGLGIYMSILFRPECPADQLMHLTCAAAVAMCDAVQTATGFRPGIKWTNDLVSGKSKLGGILSELGLSSRGNADFAIIGIGINCNQSIHDFSADIREIAASVSMVTGITQNRYRLAAAMMEALQQMDLSRKDEILTQYRRDCVTLGREISLLRGDQIRYGRALDIDDEGALVVSFSDGTTEAVSSGEVSIRGMYGYV